MRLRESVSQDQHFISAVYASGTGTTSRSRETSTSRSSGVAPAPLVEGSDERLGMDIPFGDHACERCRHSQVPFDVADGVERLSGRFDTLLSGEDLARAPIAGLFRPSSMSLPATTPGVADAALNSANQLLLESAFERVTDSWASADRSFDCASYCCATSSGASSETSSSPARTFEPRSTLTVFTNPVTLGKIATD